MVVESRAIKELAERNKLAAKKWQELGDDQKQHYHQLAVQVPSVSPDNATFNKWHETHRILSNLQDNVSDFFSISYFIDRAIFLSV